MPATIEAAPNSTKQPMITVAPKRQFIRPVSIMKPTAATAITATAVATLPSNVPSIQASAATIGPEPRGLTALAPSPRAGEQRGERGDGTAELTHCHHLRACLRGGP